MYFSRDERHSESSEGVIRMKSGDKPIKLSKSRPVAYYATSSFDKDLLKVPYTWHMIIVHHKGKYRKAQILEALYNVIGDYEFYPVAYRESQSKDKFLVRQCKNAIEILFDVCLTLQMPKNATVFLTVQFNVAEYSSGQVQATKVVEKVIEKKFKKLETTENFSQVLNLENMSSHPEMSEIIINWGTYPALELLCKIISQNHNILNTINGLNLSHNGITDPSPLQAFASTSIKMLDLRHNDIKHALQLKQLTFMELDELYVLGNPFTSEINYLDEIKALLPNLKKLDGISTTEIRQPGVMDTIEMTYPGELIRDARDHASYQTFKNSDMWHKVIIEHKGRCKKSQILKALFEAVPQDVGDFYPCYYKAGKLEDSFFVRNSFDHLQSLLDDGLALRIPNCEDIPITYRMKVAHFKKGHINPDEAIKLIITEKFNLMDRCLNLTSFASFGELRNVCLSLSNPRTLQTVLSQSVRRYATNLVELRLANNEIKTGKGLRILNNLKSIKGLDLSDNLIMNISDLESVKKLPIKELKLDGNPLCTIAGSAGNYIRQVRELFPEIVKLDSVLISKKPTMSSQKNYLCSMEAYTFVEQFITTYFTLYDSSLRKDLVEMYDEDALFSMSTSYDPSKINSYNSNRLNKYFSKVRNLKSTQNIPNRMIKNLYVGQDNIYNMLIYLPPTVHDLFSFTVDVPLFNDNLVSITITGVFEEPAPDILENDIRFSFSRTFLLQSIEKELGFFKNTTEYKIVNDVLHITNLTAAQSKSTFKFSKATVDTSSQPLTVEEKENYVIMFQEMTGLKTIWCTRCFEDGQWDFKKALEVFVKLSDDGQLPDAAFLETNQS